MLWQKSQATGSLNTSAIKSNLTNSEEPVSRSAYFLIYSCRDKPFKIFRGVDHILSVLEATEWTQTDNCLILKTINMSRYKIISFLQLSCLRDISNVVFILIFGICLCPSQSRNPENISDMLGHKHTVPVHCHDDDDDLTIYQPIPSNPSQTPKRKDLHTLTWHINCFKGVLGWGTQSWGTLNHYWIFENLGYRI